MNGTDQLYAAISVWLEERGYRILNIHSRIFRHAKIGRDIAVMVMPNSVQLTMMPPLGSDRLPRRQIFDYMRPSMFTEMAEFLECNDFPLRDFKYDRPPS